MKIKINRAEIAQGLFVLAMAAMVMVDHALLIFTRQPD